MSKKTRIALLLIVQVIIVVFTAWSVSNMFLYKGSGNMQVRQYVIFRYFTVDSNILCGLSGVALLFRLLRSGASRADKADMLCRYAGTTAVAVTMMTVLLFLGPLYGYPAMFSGWNLWLHLIGPLLAIASFLFLETDGAAPEGNHLLVSMLPVLLYGAVYLVMVIIVGTENGGWPDFYGFNRGDRWYLSFAAMAAGTALIGWSLGKIRRAVSRNRGKSA